MSDLEKVDLLLVDDRPENLLALSAVLDSPSYNLIQATSGDEALRYLLDHEPAVILMDVQMPELDGYETAALIKKNPRTRDIPIIFITATDREIKTLHKGYDSGAVDYLNKPFDTHILLSKVGVFAELSRRTRRLLRAEQSLRERELREKEQRISQLELRNLRREHADQKKYRELVDGLSHGFVWSADPGTRQITFMSSSLKEILAFEPDDCLRDRDFLAKCLIPEDFEKFGDLIKMIKKDREPLSLEHRLLRADGKQLWFHTDIRIGLNTDSSLEIRGLSVDITKIKQAEAILRKNKNHSDFLAQASLSLSESLDIQTTLDRIGELAVPKLADWYCIHALGSTGKLEVVALNHHDPTKAERARQLAEKFLSHQSTDCGVESVFKTARPQICTDLQRQFLTNLTQDSESGEFSEIIRELNLQASLVVPLIARGKTIGVLSLLSNESNQQYDEKDLHMAEDLARRSAFAIDNAYLYEQAQSAIQARDEFLSIASHELKTPITPLKLQLQSLSRMVRTKAWDEIPPPRVGKMLESCERQLQRLSKLIDDLLDISRIRIGKLKLILEEFSASELLFDIVDRFADQLALAKCDVKISILRAVDVQWDRFRIEQVLTNLLTNAMKYGQGKPIQISLWVENEKVKIAFRDYGIGIGSEDLARIFGRYERAVSGNHFGGLGLGLYIVQQIVSAHQGLIEVESELGSGASFTVTLPPRIGVHPSDITASR